MGDGFSVCADLVRDGLCLLHYRCLFTHDCWLANRMVPDALEIALNEWTSKVRNARKGFGSWADLVADGHINNKKKKKKEHRLWRVEGLQVSQ